MDRRPLTLVVLTVMSATFGCATDGTADVSAELAPLDNEEAADRACEAPAGDLTDVANEPDYRRYADYRPWTDTEGCLIRIDVLADRHGPAHCEWQDARVIVTGLTYGEQYTTYETTIEYVADPNGVFGDPSLQDAYRADATVPDDAIDTGARLGPTELWLDPNQQFAYVVEPDSVHRMPKGRPPLCD